MGVMQSNPTFIELACGAASSPSGVYVLIFKSEIVYIGSSRDVMLRIRQHRDGLDPRVGPKVFDRAIYIPVKPDRMEHYEGVMIRAARPTESRRAPRYRGDDNEILISLGLDPHEDERANAKEWLAQALRSWDRSPGSERLATRIKRKTERKAKRKATRSARKEAA